MRRNTLRVIFIAVFFTFFLFFFSCNQENRNVDDRDPISNSADRSGRTIRQSSDLREVNSSSSRFRVLKKTDFDGDDCEKDNECRVLCREIFSSSNNRDSCENYPIEMTEALYDTFVGLRSIRTPDTTRVDPAAMGFLFNEEPEMFRRQFEDEWGVRGVSAFLNWVALSSDAAQAMNYNNNKRVLVEIFLALTDWHKEPQTIARALSIGLARQRDTFLYFVQEADNENALELALELLQEDKCGVASSKGCKLLALCGRQPLAQQFSFYDSNSSNCYYLDSYEAEDADYCYIQGPDVWSYTQRSIENGDVRDNDLESGILGINQCDQFCKSQSGLCDL